MGDDFDDRDIVSPGYSVALVARYSGGALHRALPQVVAPVDADDCAPGLAQTAKEVDWSMRTARALSKPYPLEWIGISWASLNWPQSDHDGAPEGGIVQAFPWPDDDDCAPWLAPAVAAEVCDG